MAVVSQTPLMRHWDALAAEAGRLSALPARDLVDGDPRRFEQFSAAGPGLTLDYSRQRLDVQARGVLLRLADIAGLRQAIDAATKGIRLEEYAKEHEELGIVLGVWGKKTDFKI